MPRYQHMPWCVGVHEHDGWTCLLAVDVADGGRVYLTGLPCDSQQFNVDSMTLTTDDELTRLVEAVERLRPNFVAGKPATDCDQHYHNFDYDYNDHVEGCSATWEECPTCGDQWDCTTCNVIETCRGECLP